MTSPDLQPLPVTTQECRDRGWQEVDIVLVSGDAYVDHPSFGLAVIGRLLEANGYRVAVLPQPHYHDESAFRRFGRPRLFFGISGGNLDSIVANYSGNGKVRDFDAFSPGGSPWRPGGRSRDNRYRPDRAVLLYANLVRRAYPGIPVILGGIEASLRRFVHYDYQQHRLRGSHLTDAKADLLVYGMAEKTIVEAARRLASGRTLEALNGSCLRATDGEAQRLQQEAVAHGAPLVILPSWQEIAEDNFRFMTAEKIIDRHARAGDHAILLQRQQAAWLVHYPPPPPLTTAGLDSIYRLPYTRRPHPLTPDIPAFEMVKHSLTIVRGCSGNCSFCAISRHQGPGVVSRSIDSLLAEAATLARTDGFGGTISDLGGPTANLFGTHCAIGSCPRHDCLFPKVCKHLVVEESAFLALLERILTIDGVKHAFISSGLRLELLLQTPKLLEKIIKDHIPGIMKIAPEHTEGDILQLMHKEAPEHLERFVHRFYALNEKWGKRHRLSPYIISAHPGCTETHAARMVERLKKLFLTVRQFQDFTPTPGTLSTAMYVTGLHRDSGEPIPVARGQSARFRQRKLIEEAFLQQSGQRNSGSRPKPSGKPKHRDSAQNRLVKKRRR